MAAKIRGAFVDHKKVKWDTNFPDKEGWLMKRSAWMHDWRHRYFILKGSKLFFSKDESSTPHGIIDLVDCIHIKEYHQDDRENIIEMKLKSETFIIQAENREEKFFWIQTLTEAVTKYSGVPPNSSSSSS